MRKETIYIIDNLDLFENSYYIKAFSEQKALDKWYELYGDEYYKDKKEFEKDDKEGNLFVVELEYD